MESKAVKQLKMVSRLPKFASRASSSTVTPVPGSGLPVSSPESKCGPPVSQNNVTQVRSLNWRKSEERSKLSNSGSFEETNPSKDSRPLVFVTQKPSPAPTFKSKSSSSSPQTSSRIAHPSKTFPRMTTPQRLSMGSSRYNGTSILNGVNNGCTGDGVDHTSQQRTLKNKLSLSNDSLKAASKENVVRSQSFPHFKRAACRTDPPMTRSFSLNKASELAKELPRPLAQSPLARSSAFQPNSAVPEGKVGKFGFGKSAGSVCTSGNMSLGSAAKKSLLPNVSGKQHSILSYRLTRPTLNKRSQSGALQKETQMRKNLQNSTELEKGAHTTNTTSTDRERNEVQVSLGPSLETLEDMSLSSSSSLEINDPDELYMDDFDNLGNGGETLLLPDHFGLCEEDIAQIKCNEMSSVGDLQGFLSKTVDWTGTSFSDGFVDGTNSPVGDFPHDSSLDLSPSDSSGGTYMWDEEGMETLGDSGHPCGSFNSDLSSMDILNHLENVESCDLDEDDLMLDLDLSEDASFHSYTEAMSSYGSSEKEGLLAQRRRHWSLLENRPGLLQMFDGFTTPGPDGSRSDHVSLDELTLKHMTRDCSSVKEQLLQLKTMLQMETDCLGDETAETPAPELNDQPSLNQKVALLLREVEGLRKELRSKDQMITELSQQLSCPVEDIQCHCLQRSGGNKGSSELQDKDTQTLRRPQKLQILQNPRFIYNKPQRQEDQSSPASTEASSDSLDAEPDHRLLTTHHCAQDQQNPIPANCTATGLISPDSTVPSSPRTFQTSDPAQLSLSSSRLKINEPASRGSSASFYSKLEKSIQKPPSSRTSFSSIQPPGYIRKTSTPIKPKDVEQVGVFTDRLAATGPCRTKHQPSPAPGNTARQTATEAPLCVPENPEGRKCLIFSKTESGLPRAHTTKQVKQSRLPKPQISLSIPVTAAQRGHTLTSPTLPSGTLPQY